MAAHVRCTCSMHGEKEQNAPVFVHSEPRSSGYADAHRVTRESPSQSGLPAAVAAISNQPKGARSLGTHHPRVGKVQEDSVDTCHERERTSGSVGRCWPRARTVWEGRKAQAAHVAVIHSDLRRKRAQTKWPTVPSTAVAHARWSILFFWKSILRAARWVRHQACRRAARVSLPGLVHALRVELKCVKVPGWGDRASDGGGKGPASRA
jgi:hypothetical protein